MSNPIQYTSRTFSTILNDINTVPELADKPDWFKRLIAGIGDVLSIWNNATANDNFLRTAYTRQSTSDLLQLIDYQLSPQSTANGSQIFYLNRTVSFPVSLLKGELVADTTGTTSVSARKFEAREGITINTQETESIINTAVDPVTDIFTVARVYTTGELVRLTGADLPAGVSTGTDYYVIKISDTEIKLSTTVNNAFAGIAVDITAQGTSNITFNLFSFIVTVYQQESRASQTVGTSDGVTAFQEFTLPDIDILKDTVTVTVDGQPYTLVDTFVFSDATDKVCKLIYNTDNSSRLQFGNGVYGAIPPAFDVLVGYAFGGNSTSNVSAANQVTVYSGGSTNITGTTNPQAMTGGADPQDIEEAKILGPLLLKARDRFVTTEDGEALTQEFGGTSQSKVVPNAFGVLSAKVITIANGGGNPSAQFKSDLQTYLIDRTVLESIDVRVLDTTITAQNVVSGIKVLPGFVYVNIEPFVRVAWKLFFHESGKEIQDDFIANGIVSATVLINNILTESFGSESYDQLSLLLDEQNYNPRIIGDAIQESEAFAYIQSNVTGVDYLTITSPIFPIALADDEITTIGTIGLSEIP